MKQGKRKIISMSLSVIADILFVIVSALLAWQFTRGDFLLSLNAKWWILVQAGLLVASFLAVKIYSISLLSVGAYDVMRILFGLCGLGLVDIVYAFTAGKTQGIEIGFVCVFLLVLSAFVLAFRVGQRLFFLTMRSIKNVKSARKRVMIVGGGDAGVLLLREILSSDKMCIKPVCIADDNPALLSKRILGTKVAGTTFELKELAKTYAVDEIYVAMPSVSKKELKKVLERARETGKEVKVLPGLYQFANGQISVSSLRKVEIQDLLGREEISVNLQDIMEYIENKTVMVTGGGGSIGSELCRQIASHNPKKLIVLDIYENNAYDIEQELKRKYPNLDLLVLIASVRDRKKMRLVFEQYRPQIVFNAAAHKHVPLMETSPNEAVKNNVFGTLNVARAAEEFKVDTFVQISTDKAVNPTNIMGATKRICEMIIQTIGRHSKHTNFVAVRFGNVLGSNGSVIPLFKKQIEHGGPVTVTHKDIIRFFMTIPEAVSLVLQAGAYAQSGQIFVLDMGEPVKIYDLAYNLIKMSGLEPNVDIQIVCTGLRPGEKLFEERLMAEEGLQKTANGLINIARPLAIDEENLWNTLDNLYEAAYSETDSMKELVKLLVPTYIIDKRNGVKEILEKQAEEAAQETATSAS